jgi:hypothetical protein
MDGDIIISDSIKGNGISDLDSSVTKVEIWSTETIVDELTISMLDVKTFFCLINRSDVNVSTLLRSLYEAQAKYKMFRIPVFSPPPVFVVHIKHLDFRLKKELTSLDKEARDYVMKEAIGRVCRVVDKRYFLLSVKPLLRWRLEK